MKSLEDVIISIENCLIDPCPDCAIYVNNKCRKDEYTAYYLKEFQAMQDEIAALPDYYELVDFWAESQANSPLTWDELKNLKGKPVWICLGNECDNHDLWGGVWRIIGTFTGRNDELACMTTLEKYPDSFGKKSMGKTWQAYRKERGL